MKTPIQRALDRAEKGLEAAHENEDSHDVEFFEGQIDGLKRGFKCKRAPKYEVLAKPLRAKDLKGKKDTWINVVVAVSLNEVIDRVFEDFLDLLSDLATYDGCLENISYEMVGHAGDILHIRVRGDAHSLVDRE